MLSYIINKMEKRYGKTSYRGNGLLLLRLLKVNVLIAVVLNIFQLSMLKKTRYLFTVFL